MTDEFADYLPELKAGVQHLRSLPDEVVLQAARDPESKGFRQIAKRMRPSTDPHWIKWEAAEEAYKRGLISEREYDRLTD